MKCPICSLDESVWREIINLQPRFGIHHKLVWEYIEKFSVIPLRLNSKKICRLLGEMAALFDKKKFAWKKAEYEISEKGIAEALRITCNADLVTPLKDHNYLRAVLAKIANEERTEARAALDADLRKREEKIRQDLRDREVTDKGRQDLQDRQDCKGKGGEEPRTNEGDFLSSAEIKKRAGELVEKIGTKTH